MDNEDKTPIEKAEENVADEANKAEESLTSAENTAKDALTKGQEALKDGAASAIGAVADGVDKTKATVTGGVQKAKESFMHCYFGFSGRLNRRAYLIRCISLLLVSIVIAGIFWHSAGFDAVFRGKGGGGFLFGAINKLWSIIAFVSTVTLNTRRLHDFNYSGWWQILFVAPSVVAFAAVVTVVVGIAMGVAGGADAGIVSVIGITGLLVAILCWLVTIVFQIFLFFKKGTKGPNKYGEDPLADEE